MFSILLAMKMRVCAQGVQKNSLSKNKLYAVSSTCHQICFGFFLLLLFAWLEVSVFLEIPLAWHGFMVWSAALTSFLSWESTCSFLYVHVQINF